MTDNMKKYLFSAAFVSLFGIAANAQDSRSQQNSNGAKTEQGQNQATLQSVDQKAEKAEEPKAQKQAPAAKPATRMAITEKGIPASKNTENKQTQKATEAKPATSGKP